MKCDMYIEWILGNKDNSWLDWLNLDQLTFSPFGNVYDQRSNTSQEEITDI